MYQNRRFSHQPILKSLGRKPLAVAIAAASMSISASLAAQSGAGADAIEEMIVTASPLGSGRTYQAVSAYNEEQVFEMTAMSLGEMLDGEPGLSSRSFGGAPARPVIRGFDGERLLVLENGERMGDIQTTAPDHAVTLDPLGMSRIEVVRGPSSLLYGSSALGGVINIFTEDFVRSWRPGHTGGISAVGTSNNDGLATSGAYTYGTDRNAVTARFAHRSNDDSRTPSGRMPNSQLDSWTASLGWSHQADNFSGGVSVRYYESDYGIPEFAAETDPDNPDRFVEAEPDMEIRINRLNVQAHGTWETDGFFDRVQLRNSFSQSLQEEGEPDPLPEELELEISTRTLSSTLIAPHGPLAIFDSGVVGTNVHWSYQEVDGIEAYHPGQDLLNMALFTVQERALSEAVTLQVGGRLEHEWLAGVDNRFFDAVGLPDDTAFNIAASVGVGWQATDTWDFSAQLARAHRNPTVLERYADGWHAKTTRVELGDPTLDSEIGYGLDLIARYEQGPLQSEVTVFYNRIDNFVALRTLAPDCGGIDYRVRADREFPACVQFFAADAEQYGVELAADWYFTDNFRLSLVGDALRGDRRDVNEPLPFMPPYRATMGLHYESYNWRLGTSVRHVASQTRVPENELPTDAYTIVRMEGSYRFDRGNGAHSLNLRVDNLFDTAYQDHMSVVRRFQDPIAGPDAPTRFDMPGRSFTLSYRYTF